MVTIGRSLFIFVACVLSVLPLRFAFAEDAATSTPPETPVPTRAVSLIIRDGATLIWGGGVSVPDSDSATTTLSATDGTQTDALAASALAALIAADAASSEFSISNLQYFSSFGSFYVKCIIYTLERCDNWQYAVGTAYPSIGMDKFLMRDGDTLFVYFGSPRRTTLSASTVSVSEPFTATAETYIPSSDSYIPATGVTIGVTQTNPVDPYTPLIIATSTTGANGTATFSLPQEGAYAAGIAEDYYYPSVSLTVVPAPAEAPASGEAVSGPSRNGSRGGSAPALWNADITAALSFLAAHQNADGSFATPLLSDWAALAFAATPEEEYGETVLRQYLARAPFSPGSATDYERRAMALMALRVNPYSGTATDYIGKILSYFDGAQFGDPALVNDDIFALPPLLRAGYGGGDEPVARAVAFILSKQRSDDSWEGSIDLTAAAIQALASLETESGVSSALSRAREYLHAKQDIAGGFGNSFSTSWALQAIAASGDDMSLWQSPQGNNPRGYLASIQFGDGGFEAPREDVHTRVWATAYAIPAALGKSWPALLASFEKPAITDADTAATQPAPLSTSSAGAAATTSIPALGETSTTTPHDITASGSTSPRAASTSEVVISISADETPRKLVAQQVRRVPDAPEMRDAIVSVGRMNVPLSQTAAAAVAVETAGLPNIFARIGSWLKHTLSALRTLFF